MPNAPRVRLVHWNDDEGLERRKQLGALGVDALFETGHAGINALRRIRADIPDAVVIDFSRMPSHGREVAVALRRGKATRHVPIVFVDGEPAKVARMRQLIPDAAYTTWGRIKSALTRAIANPPRNPVVPRDAGSDKPAVTKLGVKPGHTVALLASPKGFAATLKPLPANVRFTARPDAGVDLFLCFARNQHELHAHLLTLQSADRQTAWLIWPKKTSGVKSDLDGNVVRHTGLAAGWVDFKVCSVDETWSGLAFKRRK